MLFCVIYSIETVFVPDFESGEAKPPSMTSAPELMTEKRSEISPLEEKFAAKDLNSIKSLKKKPNVIDGSREVILHFLIKSVK